MANHVITGMAGEFYVMERLYRLGYTPALTLGNAKSVDILVKINDFDTISIDVKSIRKGGKWGVGKKDYSAQHNLIFVLLYYKEWGDLTSQPEAYIVPAKIIEIMKKPWLDGNFAVYYSHYENRAVDLPSYRDQWNIIEGKHAPSAKHGQ